MTGARRRRKGSKVRIIDKRTRQQQMLVAMLDNELKRCSVVMAVRHGQVKLTEEEWDMITCRAY